MARRVIRVLLVGVVAALAAGPGVVAVARQDDKPVELYAPAEGSVVKDATHGLRVDFTCPVYHQYVENELVTAVTEGYHVVLSSNNLVDADGLLVVAGRIDQRDAIQLEGRDGHCTAVEDDAGNGLMPREPGTYYWQAYRDCATYVCPGGVEVSDVWSVTVRHTACSVNRSALHAARRALRTARADLHRRHTPGRRARVSRLQARVTTLRARVTVVYACAHT